VVVGDATVDEKDFLDTFATTKHYFTVFFVYNIGGPFFKPKFSPKPKKYQIVMKHNH
jgi:hypothetical protein